MKSSDTGFIKKIKSSSLLKRSLTGAFSLLKKASGLSLGLILAVLLAAERVLALGASFIFAMVGLAFFMIAAMTSYNRNSKKR